MLKQNISDEPVLRNGHQHHITMAARGYQGGSRPSLVRSNTTVRYTAPRPRSAKRRRGSGGSSIKKQIMELAETKHLKKNIVESTTLTSDIALNDPAQGPGQHQRVGSKMTVTGLYARMQFRARNAQGLMRVIFYRPRNSTNSLTAHGITLYGHVDQDEFVVYSDRYYPLSNGNGPDWQTDEVKLKFPSGLITTFDDATTSIQDNVLRMWIGGWNTLTPDEHSYDINCYFKDV
jgi:hypothetical protein